MTELLNLLIVEDERETLDLLVEVLSSEFGGTIAIQGEPDFDHALKRLLLERFDMVILDVRRGDPHRPIDEGDTEAGRLCFQAIRERRFLPVVFHTALPNQVRDLESPVVRIVEKSGPPAVLVSTVRSVIEGGLPAVVRALHSHVDRIQRDYMWEFGAAAWAEFGQAGAEDLAHILARRLALSFDEAGVQDIMRALGPKQSEEPAGAVAEEESTEESVSALGVPGGAVMGGHGVHPVRLYVVPPLEPGAHRMGDLYRDHSDPPVYWVLLTPSCDTVCDGNRPVKADRIVMAGCEPLEQLREYLDWTKAQTSNTKTSALKSLLSNNRIGQKDRYFSLPAAFALPNLVVDLANLRSLQFSELESLVHLASLDTPYAASLLTQFLRYFGRFGTADINVNYVVGRLKP